MPYKRIRYILFLVIMSAIVVGACSEVYTPKPKGYFRINLPERSYIRFEGKYPYRFDIPAYSKFIPDKSIGARPFWGDIYFGQFDAKVHLTYFCLHDDASDFYEDVRELAMKHTSKADAIDEKLFERPDKNVYGILYDIKGDVASSVNFLLTDSVNNYLRGALYFNSHPNKDSLAPVINFLKEDIVHLIETFEWKE